MIPFGTLVVYVTPKGRRYVKRLVEGQDWHSNDGTLVSAEVAQANFGSVVYTNQNIPIQVLEATLYDRLRASNGRRRSSIPRISPTSACALALARAAPSLKLAAVLAA